MTPRQPRPLRMIVLASALALSLIASIVGGDEAGIPADRISLPVEHKHAPVSNLVDSARQDPSGLRLDLLSRSKTTEIGPNIFASYAPPPTPSPPTPISLPSPPIVQQVPAPTAPALPFRYAGRLVQNSQNWVFLLRGDEALSVRVGSLIDNDYRVERITNESISFTYVPLRVEQILHFGAAK